MSQDKNTEQKNTSIEDNKVLTKLSKELADIEVKIGKKLGYKVFDYIYVLDPYSKSDIKVSGLQAAENELLQKYIDTAHSILKALEIDVELESEDLFDQFLEISHEIYLIRFTEARQLAAEYAIVRIPTGTEQELLRKDPFVELPEFNVTISIDIPDGFIIDDYGRIDLKATEANEKRTNEIKATLSAIGEMLPVKEQMYSDMFRISHKAIMLSLNSERFKNFCEYAAQFFLVISAKLVYKYIQQGYSIIESKENVHDYLKKQTDGFGTKFPADYENLVSQLKEDLQDVFEGTKATKETIDTITNEFLELWVFYLNEGTFIPENYYETRFRDSKQFNTYEQYYHYIIDVFPYDDYGQLLWTPIEAYDIDFSQNTKKTIFEVVTNGIQNPDLTLDDYLRLG